MKVSLIIEFKNPDFTNHIHSSFQNDKFGILIPFLDENEIRIAKEKNNPLVDIYNNYGTVDVKISNPLTSFDITNVIKNAHESVYEYIEETKSLNKALHDEIKDIEVEIDLDDEFELIFAPDEEDTENSVTENDYSHNPWKEEPDFISSWPKPKPNQFAWYLEDGYTQLRTAYNSLENKEKIRIGHLDTGVSAHIALPENLRIKEGWDFKEKDSDPTDPMNYSQTDIRLPGHGTGTMVILAGKDVPNSKGEMLPIGGNPSAEIIPIRVGNSPVNAFTRRMGKAFMYALEKNCEIISMSMGGAPSRLTAKAINALYENGVIVVTAGGNNYKRRIINNFITKSLVYPARFNRVIAVCGMTYDYKPYWKKFKDHTETKVMQGNWGPYKAMYTAVSAFTPNVPWAIGDNENTGTLFRKKGGGTSAATPQVAAAASLYLAEHKTKIDALIGDNEYDQWKKAEIVHQAIFKSSKNKTLKGEEVSFLKNGNGFIQANDLINNKEYQPENMIDGLIKPNRAFASIAIIKFFSRIFRLTAIEFSDQEILALANEMGNLFYYDNDFDTFIIPPDDKESIEANEIDFTDDNFFDSLDDETFDKLVDKIKNSTFVSETFKKMIFG